MSRAELELRSAWLQDQLSIAYRAGSQRSYNDADLINKHTNDHKGKNRNIDCQSFSQKENSGILTSCGKLTPMDV